MAVICDRDRGDDDHADSDTNISIAKKTCRCMPQRHIDNFMIPIEIAYIRY